MIFRMLVKNYPLSGQNVKLCRFCVSGWMLVLVGGLILLFNTTLTFCPHLSASSPNLCFCHLSGCGLSSQTGITCVRCQVHLCIQVWRASINPCLKCHWPSLVSCGQRAPGADLCLMHSLLRPCNSISWFHVPGGQNAKQKDFPLAGNVLQEVILNWIEKLLVEQWTRKYLTSSVH